MQVFSQNSVAGGVSDKQRSDSDCWVLLTSCEVLKRYNKNEKKSNVTMSPFALIHQKVVQELFVVTEEQRTAELQECKHF